MFVFPHIDHRNKAITAKKSYIQVLERAKERESLEDLRARTAAQFSDGQDGISSTKISKKRKHMAVLDEANVKFGRIAD